MEKKKPKSKQSDSIIVGTIIWSLMGIGMGVFHIITKREGALAWFILGVPALICLIYLLRKTKNNTNERYEDERKKFVSDKSKSMSFDKLFIFMVIFEILIQTGKIKMDSYDVIMVVIGSALIIQFISYLVCKSKY
ncbi:DUF2178 domain-containing protein (plasmid) [Clostridium estertheticum]|uniref:DUF2178 domain-containing protein n=1 Tax=Clostridium estertheticum TaxID=238834 RepID=UPI001C7D8962|nr:DUF2178 domain-containing protein [Clostridium estertheticum]MBX4262851.1 DUF2178 domain-containing protein [Clostridium estertheticum]WLC73145.1 DUF2178 domain-containing protein [Clostridium estertheticum]